MLRHMFAIEKLNADASLEDVSLLLAHPSIKITERHYLKLHQRRQERPKWPSSALAGTWIVPLLEWNDKKQNGNRSVGNETRTWSSKRSFLKMHEKTLK
jgi:hypothetical protein